jgi:hypothetical protein
MYYLDIRVLLPEVSASSSYGSSCPNTRYKAVNLSCCSFPDFRPRGLIMNLHNIFQHEISESRYQQEQQHLPQI